MALCAHVHVVYKVSAERCSPRGKGRSEEGVGGEWEESGGGRGRKGERK